jgi:hypothetical protein
MVAVCERKYLTCDWARQFFCSGVKDTGKMKYGTGFWRQNLTVVDPYTDRKLLLWPFN